MEKQPLTSRQKEILDFMEAFTVEAGYPPTVREICKATGLKSPRSVSQHLQALERKGYIERGRDKSRAIRFLHKKVGAASAIGTNDLVTLSLLGKVAAGQPALSTDAPEGAYTVDRNLFGQEDAFLLRVEGDSMVDAHIMEGDLIVVKPESDAHDGDVVVAMVGNETTVKRFESQKGSHFLVPENGGMEPIEIAPNDPNIRILGKVVGLIRSELN